MPLLGTKAFILKSSEGSGAKRAGKFFLQLTNEYFDSREELEERIKFYDRKIWSCRCTGHPNLNYAEAYRNESRILESLSRTFPLVFEAAVLHFVHLSKSPLPPLIDGICRMISEKLFIGEPVEFKVKKDSDIVRGKICHPNGSFDVSTDPNLINFHQYVPGSASCSSSKQSPIRYTVKLDSENKLVCNVPGCDLVRLTHVPSKENVRVFIRCNAIRFGVRPESPWVVDKEARCRAGIPDIAYPAEIEAAIMSHTVYSKNMRLTPTGKDSIHVSIVNDPNGRCVNGQNGRQKADFEPAVPKLQAVSVKLDDITPKQPPMHPSVARVLKEVEKNGMQSTHTKYLISRLARELNAEERENLPEEIKSKVYERLELLEEKRMMASLTAEEKKSYLSEKMRRKMLELRLENRTSEDTEFVRENPIPQPHPIEAPYGIPNSLIGDVFFICEFFDCFSRILTMEEKLELTFDSVCGWLANEGEVVPLLELIVSLVKAILQDEMFQDVSFYNVNLVQIPLCSYSSPEFARLCLKNGRLDVEDVYKDPEAGELVDLLTESDFHSLTTRDQLRVVAALCHLLLDCEYVDDEINRCTKEIKSLRGQISKLLPGPGAPPGSSLSNGSQRSGSKKESTDTQPHTMLDEFVIRIVDEAKGVQREASSKTRLEQMQAEKERKQKQRQEAEECRRLQNLQRLEDKLAAKREALAKMTRHRPLGLDSDYNRYWLLNCFDGIVVEKRRDVGKDLDEGPSSWFYYKTEDELSQLMNALLPKGDRESHLLSSLKKNRSAVLKSMGRIETSSGRSSPATVTDDADLVQACKENLRSLETRIASAGLGGVENQDAFYRKLGKAKTTNDIGDCLLQVQKGVIRRFAAGMFRTSPRPMESNSDGPETRFEKEWIEHLRECRTFSRLYFLTDALDSSMQWSLSVRNARCKVCRRLSDDEVLLLCDGCNSAYHPGCLRPPLLEVPEGEWWCVTCARNRRENSEPRLSRGHGVNRRHRSTSGEGKWRCSICDECDNSPAMMAQCRVCQCCVHLVCHSPPIRNTKRSDWVCWKCRFSRAAAETATSSSISSTRKRSWESCSNDSMDEV